MVNFMVEQSWSTQNIKHDFATKNSSVRRKEGRTQELPAGAHHVDHNTPVTS